MATVRNSRAAIAEGNDICRELRAISAAIDALARTIDAVERREVRAAAMQHIDSIELSIRKAFVRDSRQQIQRIEAVVQGRLLVAQKDWQRGGGSRSASAQRGGGSTSQRAREGGRGVGAQTQARLFQQQQHDADLDTLLTAVTDMGNAAKQIGSELDDHNDILSEMDRDATYADLAVGKLNRGVAQILKNGTSCLSLWVIVALTATLIVLILLVIFL